MNHLKSILAILLLSMAIACQNEPEWKLDKQESKTGHLKSASATNDPKLAEGLAMAKELMFSNQRIQSSWQLGESDTALMLTDTLTGAVSYTYFLDKTDGQFRNLVLTESEGAWLGAIATMHLSVGSEATVDYITLETLDGMEMAEMTKANTVGRSDSQLVCVYETWYTGYVHPMTNEYSETNVEVVMSHCYWIVDTFEFNGEYAKENWDFATTSEGGGSAGDVANPSENPVDSIYNKVSEPCLKQAIETALSKDFKNQISDLANSFFANTDQIDMEFFEDNSLPDDVLAETMSGGNIKGGYFVATIYLNSNVLPTSTEEVIISTIYHEVVHAYLRMQSFLTGIDINQHDEMAQNYLNSLTNSLMALFPGLPIGDATALTWAGLQDSNLWLKFQQSKPKEANNILKLIEQYVSAEKGTPCPKN